MPEYSIMPLILNVSGQILGVLTVAVPLLVVIFL